MPETVQWRRCCVLDTRTIRERELFTCGEFPQIAEIANPILETLVPPLMRHQHNGRMQILRLRHNRKRATKSFPIPGV